MTVLASKRIVHGPKFVELGGLEALIADLSKVARSFTLEDVREALRWKQGCGALGPINAWLVSFQPAIQSTVFIFVLRQAQKASPRVSS